MIFSELNRDADLLMEKIGARALDADQKFREYLQNVKDIGGFSGSTKWDAGWRDRIYSLGKLFSEPNNLNPGSYLAMLNELNTDGKNEPLSFIYSEIIWNFYINKQGFVEDEFKRMTVAFPGNPEFFHSYGHYLLEQENFVQAFKNYKQAINLENNNVFVTALFNAWAGHFSRLIQKNKIEEAKKLLSEIEEFFGRKEMESYFIFKNITYSMSDRLKDMVVIDQRIKNIGPLIDKKVEKIEGGLVAIVTFVTALVAYLIIGANVVIHAGNIKDSFFLLYGLGIVILIFSISLSYLFRLSRDQESFWFFLKDKRFLAIIFLMSVLLISYHAL